MRQESSGKKYCIMMAAAVLAILIAVTVPSCRRGKTCIHGDDAHYAQVDSLLRGMTDVDSLVAMVNQYHKNGDVTGEMIALRYQGRTLRHQSRFDEAIAAHSRGLNIAMSVCDTLEIISALNNIGTDYRREGDLSKANGFHYKALSYSNAYSDHISPEAVKARVMALNGIGNIEIELRHYASADSVLRLALQGERSLGSDLGMAINYSNLGAIKRALGEADSAWAYYGESLKHNQLAGNQLGVALCHLNYGELYADERNFSRAQVEYKQAYQLLKELGDAYHWLESCLSLASVSMMLGEKEEALQYVQEAEAEALRINSKEHQARAYHIFYELALLGGDTRSALDFYIKSDALYDSIYGLEKSNEMRHQRTEYETNVKQGEMSLLNNDIAHLKRLRNMMMLFTVLLLIMAGAIIAALLYAARVRVRTQRLMRQVEETRSLFFTNVVHQLRTPLTAIMGATDGIIAQAGGENSPQQRENVEIIERQGNHLLLLVDRILEVGSVRSAVTGPDWRRGDVVAYLRMIVESYREQCVERQIELTYAPTARELEIDVVPHYLNTIVGSLIENAISYSEAYGKITVTSQLVGDMLVIRVADNGMGISQDDLPHVFEAFYRAPAAEQLCEGVGIGLTVVRDMATVMGGSVAVESTLGNGSTFTVSLPCYSNQAGEIQRLAMEVEQVRPVVRKLKYPVEEELTGDAGGNKGRPCILVVEDHSDVARIIGAALGGAYTIQYASNGKHGLAQAAMSQPDLIITDVKMPYMDGLEMCRRLRASQELSHIPVIMLSARTSRSDRILGIKAGADVYMVKPFDSDEIKAWVAKLLEKREKIKDYYSNTLSKKSASAIAGAADDTSINDQALLNSFAGLVEEQMADGGARVNLDQIALRLKMGESQLRRRILELTGKNVAAYIMQLRMEKAMRLLCEHPTMLVGDVAGQCGFGDVAYFSRVFRQHYKMTPTQARNERSS